MRLLIEISDEMYKNVQDGTYCGSLYEELKKGKPQETVTEFADRCRECGREKVLDKIRAEIEKPLHDERCFDTADAKAQYIALNWCVEIIDKYRAERNDKE